MLFNLLTATEDKFRSVEVGEASLYALLGFAVVFVGIAFLIFVVWLIGKLMVKLNPVKTPKQHATTPVVNETAESLAIADATSDEISEETVAVITAALMAYYQRTNPQCEFTVKRIKRI